MPVDIMKDVLHGERLSSQETHQASVHESYRNILKEWFHKSPRKTQRDQMVVEWCTKTTLYDDKSHDLTDSYLLKQQSRSKSFPNAPHAFGIAPAYTKFRCNAQPIQTW